MAPRRWGRVGPLSWMLRRLFGLELRLTDVDGPARGAGDRRGVGDVALGHVELPVQPGLGLRPRLGAGEDGGATRRGDHRLKHAGRLARGALAPRPEEQEGPA